jgi:hypothetical protein
MCHESSWYANQVVVCCIATTHYTWHHKLGPLHVVFVAQYRVGIWTWACEWGKKKKTNFYRKLIRSAKSWRMTHMYISSRKKEEVENCTYREPKWLKSILYHASTISNWCIYTVLGVSAHSESHIAPAETWSSLELLRQISYVQVQISEFSLPFGNYNLIAT